MTRNGAVSDLEHEAYGDDDVTVIIRALDALDVSGGAVPLDERGDALVVEPRSLQLAAALRGAGFAGDLVALASVPIGKAYGVAADYTRVIVDDWLGRATGRGRSVGRAAGESHRGELRLGAFQTIIVTDLTRYVVADDAPAALIWLADRLETGGLLALADPALALTPERMAEAFAGAGLELAAAPRVLRGDWPRTLTLWRRVTPVEPPAHPRGASEAGAPLAGDAQRPAPVSKARITPFPVFAAPRAGTLDTSAALESASPFHRALMRGAGGRLAVTLRAGTGLTVVVASEGALTSEERAAISRYRLEQYVQANIYSAEAVERWGLQDDPSMALLNAADTHVIVATADGLIVSYMCLQMASSALSDHAADVVGAHTLGESARPLFPVETEFGELLAHHPGLRTLPIASVREITRLVRNQRPDLRARLREVADVAVAETIMAATRYVIAPANLVEAIVGCIAPEARQALVNFRIPVAYAPDAPITGENLGGGAPDGPMIWTDEAREAGRFWPFAISTLDVRRQREYFAGLSAALDGPTIAEARSAVNRLRTRAPLRPPRFAASFFYKGYRESGALAQVALPVTWVGLNERGRPVSEQTGAGGERRAFPD